MCTGFECFSKSGAVGDTKSDRLLNYKIVKALFPEELIKERVFP